MAIEKKTKDVKDIFGKIVPVSKSSIKKEAVEAIKLYNSLKIEKVWKEEAEKNLVYWKHLLNQVK